MKLSKGVLSACVFLMGMTASQTHAALWDIDSPASGNQYDPSHPDIDAQGTGPNGAAFTVKVVIKGTTNIITSASSDVSSEGDWTVELEPPVNGWPEGEDLEVQLWSDEPNVKRDTHEISITTIE